MAEKPKMSGLNSCDDFSKQKEILLKKIKDEDGKYSPEEIKLFKEQLQILQKQWLDDCAPKGKKVNRLSE